MTLTNSNQTLTTPENGAPTTIDESLTLESGVNGGSVDWAEDTAIQQSWNSVGEGSGSGGSWSTSNGVENQNQNQNENQVEDVVTPVVQTFPYDWNGDGVVSNWVYHQDLRYIRPLWMEGDFTNYNGDGEMLIEKDGLRSMKVRTPYSTQFSGRQIDRHWNSADYLDYSLLAMEDNFDTRMIGDREYFVVPEEHWYGDVGVSLRDMRAFNALVEYNDDTTLGFGQSDPEGRVYW